MLSHINQPNNRRTASVRHRRALTFIRSDPAAKGFTIAELLVVVVLIGILASIVISVVAGVQSRARDTDRKTDLATIAKALYLYKVDNGHFLGTGSGCGFQGNGVGFFNYQSGTYPVAMNQCLKNSGYLDRDLSDPSGQNVCSGLTCRAYMKYDCGAVTYIFANLEEIPHTATDTDATCQPALDTGFGMNYYMKLE